MREYSISKWLVENYLHQPYCWFLNRHSANLGKIKKHKCRRKNLQKISKSIYVTEDIDKVGY
jgi:hypothetical protein